jgi:NADPH-dependent 2,4-dienoyl-CoA reductase/sulfur reductase-like enzyme
LPTPARRLRVLVVGAGAAGLETARVLASQGHTVEVRDRAERAGGVLDAVAAADPVLARYRDWLRDEATAAGVRVVTGTEVTPADATVATDVVVVATGPSWSRPEVTGAVRVLTPPEVGPLLAAGAVAPGTAVVVGGGKPGLTLALAFAARGTAVTVVEPSTVFGTELGLPGRWRTVADAEAAGIVLLGDAVVTAVTPTTVEVRVAGETRSLPAQVAITTRRVAGAPPLADTLRAAGVPVHVVGDALDARGFEGITRDAEDTARALARAD